MQKFYCDRCRQLYDELQTCKRCGTLAAKKIWIEVQIQPDSK